METKVCSRTDCHMAGQPQPLSAFQPDPRYRLGVRGECRKCHSKRCAEWQKRNRERANALARAWRRRTNNDGEKNNTVQLRKWRERNPEYNREACAKHYQKHRAQRLAYQRAYAAKKRAEKQEQAA